MSSTPSERSPLLPTQIESPTSTSAILSLLKAEGEPSWLQSFKFYFFGSYLNLLLLFVPLSFLAHNLQWDAALRFSFSFVAIIPLAAVCSLNFQPWSCLTIFIASWPRNRGDVHQAGLNMGRLVERIVRKCH